MGILLYTEYDICQICMLYLYDIKNEKVDGPSLKSIIIFDGINENCNHFFHENCIKKEFDDYINNGFPFKLHCNFCGYLRKYSYTCFWELSLYKTLINEYTNFNFIDEDQ